MEGRWREEGGKGEGACEKKNVRKKSRSEASSRE